MPQYRPSVFNIPVRNEAGGLHALYNTATGNYLVADDEIRVSLEHLRAGDASLEQSRRLLEAGMAVRQDVDEVQAVAEVFGLFRGSRYAPHLTIAPTLDCNFGCSYCFETHKPGNMTVGLQDRLLDFARHLLDRSSGNRKLSVSWFGGEPLMALPVIERLTRQFQAMRAAGEIDSYGAILITNGIGLTAKVCDRIAAFDISQVQVTLDGPRQIHDARRFLKRGNGATFDRILANLHNVPPSMRILIRVNIDKGNADEVAELCEQLGEAGLLPRILVDLARVERFSLDADAPLLTPREFALFKNQMQLLFAEKGWPLLDSAPTPSLQGVCQVDSQNSFVVAADGQLYKCWAELENDGFAVGRLDQPAGWDTAMPSDLTARDPFDDAECRSCALLPTCLGSCPKVRSINRHLGQKECPPFKYRMADLVRRQFGDRTHIERSLPVPAA